MGSRFGLSMFQVILIVTVLGLLFPAQLFWFRAGWQAIREIRSPGWNRFLRILLVLAALWLVVVLVDRIFKHFLPHRGPGFWMVTAAHLWLFPSFFAFLLVKLVHAAEWVWTRVTLLQPSNTGASGGVYDVEVDLPRRLFFRYTTAIVGAIPLVAAVYGYAKERLQYTVRRVDVPIANLPTVLDGFQIVQLSDIHIGDFMPREEVRRAVDMANELRGHVAFVTGDFITDGHDPLETCIAELSRLTAPLGVWGCNGNHEIYADAEESAQELFQKYGMRLLRQENAPLLWRGGEINLIGVDYQREILLKDERRPMLTSIESLVRRNVPNVLLSHNPNSFYRAAELGIELSLAGHTHGGQVQVEILDHRWSPARFITSFVAGLYALPMGGGTSQAFLYVNRGLGTIGVPVRLGAEPEITLLTLRGSG
jgi:uncharacterized protein